MVAGRIQEIHTKGPAGTSDYHCKLKRTNDWTNRWKGQKPEASARGRPVLWLFEASSHGPWSPFHLLLPGGPLHLASPQCPCSSDSWDTRNPRTEDWKEMSLCIEIPRHCWIYQWICPDVWKTSQATDAQSERNVNQWPIGKQLSIRAA